MTPPDLGMLRAHIAAGPMLIEEAFLDSVCAVIDRGGQLGPGPDESEAAMGVFLGRYDGRSRLTVTDDGIAIVGVRGLLVNRGGWLGSIWGMTSYEGLAEQMRRCAADPDVRHIVLDVDSGGGMVAGIWDLMPTIAAARAKKPVTAIANAWACSAAYAIACAAGELYVNRSSTTGSIGVVRQHVDTSGAMAKWGYRVTLFKAGAFKTAGSGVEELTPEVRAYIQAGIDEAYAQFVDHVAEHRGLDAAAVRATEARVYGAADAVDLGLADGMLSIEELIDHIRVPRRVPASRAGPPAPARSQKRETPMTLKPGQAAAGTDAGPDLATAISATIAAMRGETQAGTGQQQPADDRLTRAEAEALATEAATRAVTADRERTATILSLAEASGHETRALKLAHETSMSVEQIKAFLADLPKPTAAGATTPGFEHALRTAMQAPGSSAGVKPDAGASPTGASAAGSRPSLAAVFADRFKPARIPGRK
ncbi:MAG: S49 family peptidase [Hyphomicrobiaceae bacterium]